MLRVCVVGWGSGVVNVRFGLVSVYGGLSMVWAVGCDRLGGGYVFVLVALVGEGWCLRGGAMIACGVL